MAEDEVTDEALAEMERFAAYCREHVETHRVAGNIHPNVLAAELDSLLPAHLRLIAALRASREDLRIANEAGLALLATAAEATRELERLREGRPDTTITRERTIVSREPVILWLWQTHRWAYHAFFGVLFALILFLAAT